MKRSVAILAVAGLGLTAIALALGSGLRASQAPPPRTPQGTVAPAAGDSDSTPVPPLARNPFEYEEQRAPAWRPAPRAVELELAPASAVPPPAAPVRLVGFVERAGKSRAALVVRGEMLLLEVGESALGFTLLAADEESGVRLRGPGGVEIALAPEP